MKALAGVGIALLCAGGLFAQHGSSYGAFAPRAAGGSMAGHGSHGSPAIRWPYSGGYRGYSGAHVRGPVFAYPVFVSGFADYGYGPYGYGDPYAGVPPQAGVSVINAPQAAPETASPVIINLGILPAQGAPSGAPPPAPPSAYQEPGPAPDQGAAVEPTHYLIALKDHTIYSAVAYWVDGSTLHYFTTGSTHNQISLSLVDRDLTERLNQGSGLEVKLPPAR